MLNQKIVILRAVLKSNWPQFIEILNWHRQIRLLQNKIVIKR